jgi:hypothetical protein
MKYTILIPNYLLLLLALSQSSNAQTVPAKSIQITAGYSKHGSGDMNGILFGAEYIKFYSKRFSLNYNFRGTINHGKDEIIVNDLTNDIRTDASVRFTTAGVQAGVNAGYSFIKTTRHDFKISLGGFARYQSASNGSDGYILYGPQSTGVPSVLIGYNNTTPQETYSVGAIFQLQYDFRVSKKVYIGIIPGFQTDTNGDAIVQLALTVGRNF